MIASQARIRIGTVSQVTEDFALPEGRVQSRVLFRLEPSFHLRDALLGRFG